MTKWKVSYGNCNMEYDETITIESNAKKLKKIDSQTIKVADVTIYLDGGITEIVKCDNDEYY